MDILPLLWWLFLNLSPHVNSQANLNSLATTYPSQQTMSVNGTWFIVQVPIATAAAIVGPSYNLLTFPSNNAYCNSVSRAGMHPIMITPGCYDNDIRMGILRVDHLLQSGISVLCVDCTKDGKSPCQYNYKTFVSGLVPALASTALFGSDAILGYFNPSDAASKFTPPDSYTDQTTVGVGTIAQLLGESIAALAIPVPQLPVIDATFSILTSTSDHTYPAAAYITAVNQILISNQGVGNCILYRYLVDDKTTAFLTGNLTTYAPVLPQTYTVLDTFDFVLGLFVGSKSSTFQNVPGYAANLQGVNCNSLTMTTKCADIVNMPTPTGTASLCPVATSAGAALPGIV